MDQHNDVEKLLQPIGKARLHESISQQLNQLIDDGKLSPGDRLPSERELAERFKVSRNSVRDALRTMEARGLLEIRQGDGTYVREMKPAKLYSGLLDVLVSHKESIREILQVRRVIEPGIAYYAALNVQPSDIVTLEAIVAQQEAKAAQADPGVEEDAQFHAIIAHMSHNQILIALMHEINRSIATARDMLLKYDNTATRLGHRRVLDALRARDPEQAQHAMAMHIDEVMASYELVS